MHEPAEAAPVAAPPKARTPFLRKLLFAAIPCLVLLLVLEGVFRIAGLGAPEVTPPSSPDFKEAELAAPDGRKSVYRDGLYVGRPIRLNETGFRDWLYEKENSEGALRVAGLGDSFTFGDGLPQEETWLRRLEEKLAPRVPAPRKLRTLNFGRRGANTAEEAKMLPAHVFPFRPDAVVLGFTLFNDAESAKQRAEVTRDVVVREESFTFRTMRWAHDHSYLVNFVSDRVRRQRKRREMVSHITSEYADDAPGWIECRTGLASVAAQCREAHVPLAVLIFPAHHRDPVLNDWSRYEFKAQHDKLRAALAAFPEVEIVDMADHLTDLSGRTIWIEGNGHPDAVYADRAAEALVAPLSRLLHLGVR